MRDPRPEPTLVGDWSCLNCMGQMRPGFDDRLGDVARCTECGMVEPI